MRKSSRYSGPMAPYADRDTLFSEYPADFATRMYEETEIPLRINRRIPLQRTFSQSELSYRRNSSDKRKVQQYYDLMNRDNQKRNSLYSYIRNNNNKNILNQRTSGIRKADKTYNGIPMDQEKMYQLWLSRTSPELKRIDIDIQRMKRLKQKFDQMMEEQYPKKTKAESPAIRNMRLRFAVKDALQNTDRGIWNEYPEEFNNYTNYLRQNKADRKLNELNRTDLRSTYGYIPTEEPTFAQYTLTNRVTPMKTSGTYYQQMTERGNPKNISPLLSIVPRRDFLPEISLKEWKDNMPRVDRNKQMQGYRANTKKSFSKRAIPTQRTENSTNKYGI